MMAFIRLQAGGRPDLIAKVHLAEIIPYLALLYFGLLRLGIVGAALAWAIRCAADAVILMLIDKVDRSALRLLSVHGAIVLASILIMFLTPPNSGIHWLLIALLAALTAFVLIRTAPPQLALVGRRLRNKNRIGTGTT
jgi:hypothetical protein